MFTKPGGDNVNVSTQLRSTMPPFLQLHMDPDFRNLSPDMRREVIVGNPSQIWMVTTIQTIQGAHYVTIEQGPAG